MAVLGSVRINGEVGDQVVAVLGSVDLGPHAVVHGDVVTVGGRLRRAPDRRSTAPSRKCRWEMSAPRVQCALARRMGALSTCLAALVRSRASSARPSVSSCSRSSACLALVVARRAVEGSAQRVTDDPVTTTLVGLAAWVLFVPLFVLTADRARDLVRSGFRCCCSCRLRCVVLLLMAVVGFSGTAYAVGQWARRRFGIANHVRVCRHLPGDPDHPAAASARPRRGAGRLAAQPGRLPAGGDRSGRGVPRLVQRVRRGAHQYVLALAGHARRAFVAERSGSDALRAIAPSPPPFVTKRARRCGNV